MWRVTERWPRKPWGPRAIGITAVAGRPGFDRELDEMRRRLEESDSRPNLKTGQGGTYDIDYLIGRLQAKHGVWSNHNLSERVGLIRRHGLLEEAESRELAENAEFLRLLEHNIRLVTGMPGKWHAESGTCSHVG